MTWPEVALGDVARIMRHSVSPADRDPSERYLGLEHIERGGRILGSQSVGDAELKSTKFEFKHNQVLYGKLRPNLGKIARPTFDGICSTDILPVAPGPRLDRDFLAHYLSQDGMVVYAAARAAGANLPRLSPQELAKFPLPLPPLDEQRRIAAILDRVDALRATNTDIVTRHAELRSALYEKLLATSSWLIEPLGELLTRIDSGSSPVCEARPATEHEWGVLKLGSVSYGEFRSYENKAFLGQAERIARNEIHAGDVLMSRKNTRELVGRAVVVHDGTRPRLTMPDLIFRLVPKQGVLTPSYLCAALGSRSVRNVIQTAAGGSAESMVNISKERLGSLRIAVPGYAEQQHFSTQISAVQASLERTRKAAAGFDTLFASLQARAFRGEL